MENYRSDFKISFQKLIDFCQSEDYKGWDPYDGLNSWIIQKTLIGNSKFLRLAWIQFFKRSPINLRNVFGIKKDYNPKGLGLFLTGYCNLYLKEPKEEYLEKINLLATKVLELKTPGYSGACWGYNFDWQARAFFQPKYTPTVVATSFIVEALLMAYDITNRDELLHAASSASKFVLEDLKKSFDDEDNYTFSYSPLDKTQVLNAGLLGAKLLSLVYLYNKDENLINEAKKVVSYVCTKQTEEGSWPYGSLPYHQWVDNFHTGYNLECIQKYQELSGDLSFQKNIDKGFDYYINTFFTEEGISKYYNNKMYPIDIHSPAQLVVTLSKLNKLRENKELVDKVINWTINNMQSSKGFFYYQKKKNGLSKIPYIRWAQAWMFYAFSFYFLEFENE